MATSRICSVAGCGKPTVAKALCNAHYLRFRKYGDPEGASDHWGKPLRWLRDNAAYEGDACLIWPFARNSEGYGHFGQSYRTIYAHRWLCEHVHGPAPQGEEVAHSCGKGHLGCVNPRHVRWAMKLENEADKLLHGTAPQGSRNPMSKLSDSDIQAIRSLKGVLLQRQIAERFGVRQGTVSRIHAGKRWSIAE